jgi:hypothetical protein
MDKENLWEEKIQIQPSLAGKTFLKGKKSKLVVTCATYIDVFVILKHKCLWRGIFDGLQLLVRLTFAIWLFVILSHHENEIFQVKP